MRRYFVFTKFFVLMAVVLFSTSANAAFTVYSSRSTFDAAVSGASVENWDGFSAGTTFANGSTVNGITYNSSTGLAIVTNAYYNTTNPNSLGRTTYNYFLQTDTMTFGFTAPIYAFGIDINTYALTSGAYQALTNLGNIALSGYDPFPGLLTGQFVGFISDSAINSVTISSLGSDSYTLDTLRYSAAVPEPITMLLLGFGLVGLAGVRRFKK